MTNILLVQLADIGDLILTTPALVALRQAQPQAHLTLLTTRPSEQVIEEGLVDEIISIDRRLITRAYIFFRPESLKQLAHIRERHFDTVVFFHHFTFRLGTLKFAFIAWLSGAKRVIGLDNGNGWFLTDRIADNGFGAKHQAQYWLDLVGLLGTLPQTYRAQVAFYGGILPIPATAHKRVVIHTGSGGYSLARRWLPQYFADVADTLNEKFNAQIIFVGTQSDGADAVLPLVKRKYVDLIGKTSLTQLADLIRSADLYIGADSGVMHMAAAVRTPTIALFGSSNADAWAPWSPNGTVMVMRSAPLCSPCSYVEHRIGSREGCKERTCMAMVTPAQVIEVAEAILGDRPLPKPKAPRSPIVHGERTFFLGFGHDRITTNMFLKTIEAYVKVKTFKLVVLNEYDTPLLAKRDPILRVILERAHLVVPCGTGLTWASNWKQDDLPERISRFDLLASLLETCAQRGWRVFLVGKYAPEAAYQLKLELPRLSIAGTSKLSDSALNEHLIIDEINASQADLVLVNFGTPRGEKWLARNSSRLRTRVGIEIGDVMQELANRMPQTPEIIEDLQFSWLYQMLAQPKRLKMLWRIPQFVWGIISGG